MKENPIGNNIFANTQLLIMKILPLLLVTGITFSQLAHTQTIDSLNIEVPTSQNLNVKGTLVDATTQMPIEMANVVLQPIGGTQQYFSTTDENGHFIVEDVPPGNYKMSLFFIGFKRIDKEVTISMESTDLGSITMQNESSVLKEVTVSDFRKMIEQRPDGITYNAENDKSNLGTTATEVLRKVPMVSVDMQGNVQLRGNSAVRVQIDGRPSELVAASVQDVLRQIPADNIKTIEVITSPGAKYDGEGAAGVINIITKKKTIQGLSGSIFLGPAYNFDQDLLTGNLGGSLNYRQGKFGVNFSAGVSRWAMVLESEGGRTDFPGANNETRLTQNQRMYGRGNFGWTRLGADYQLDSLQVINAGVNYNPGEWMQDVDLEASYPATGMHYRRSTKSRAPRQNVGFNAGYSKKFRSNPKRTFDLLGSYSIGNRNSQYDLTNLDIPTNVLNYKERNENLTQNNELTVQADYVHPLTAKNEKLEFGAKVIDRDIKSDYVLSEWSLGEADYHVNPNRSNMLKYNQLVGGIYSQYTRPLTEQLSMIAGLRYELTRIHGNVRDNGGDFELPLIHSLLPNITFMYDLKNFSKIRIGYNKRIERPSINYVNPYIDYSDPMNLKRGNPHLEPERNHNIEMGYSTFIGRSSLNLSPFYRFTDNGIEPVTTVDNNGISMTEYGNLARRQTIGIDANIGANLFNKLQLNINGNAYYKILESDAINRRNEGLEWKANMMANYRINDIFGLSAFGMYNGNQVQLQGLQGGWYYYSLGADMKIFKGKGTLGIGLDNIFTPVVKIRTSYEYQNANYDMLTKYLGRGVRLSFNYNFGKMQFQREKTIRNDDLKKDDGGQIGGGSGGGR